MVEQIERTKRTFLYLNDFTFEITSVEGVSTENPNQWYIPNEGVVFTIGKGIFNDMKKLKSYAVELYNRKEDNLNHLRERLDNM